MIDKIILALFGLVLIIVGAGISITIPKKATAPVAPPLNAHCTIQNHKKDLVCVVNGEPIIARLYR
jgi:hypothetical protein